MKYFTLFSAIFLTALFPVNAQNIDRTCATCSRTALDSANLHINPVRVNQVGYRTADPHKCAYVANPTSDQFTIVRAEDGETVYSGTLVSLGSYPDLHGEIFIRGYYNSITPLYTFGDTVQGSGPNDLYRADFGDFEEEGTYQLVVENEISLPFDIRPTIYNDVFETVLKFFGINRCGDTKSWIHDACHLRDGSALGEEYAGRLSGGWHDCGDHGKYSETVGYTALVLSLTYAVFPQKAEDRYGESYNDTLPFGNDGIPDLLWEAKVGADYIYKLYSVSKEQGLVDSGDMYHSVGSGPGMDHNYWDVPENQDAQPEERGGPDRPVTAGIGSNVAGMYAASLALFSWGWEPFDPEYAGRLREAAVDIYDNIIMKNLNSSTTMPCCYTGGGRKDDDEGMAALALWFATGEERFGYDLLENTSINDNPNHEFNMNEFAAGHMGASRGFHAGGWTTDYQQVFPYALYGLAKLILPDDATAARYGVESERRQDLMERILATMKYHIETATNGSNSTKYPGINVDEPYHGVFTSADWGYNRYNMGMVIELFMYWDLTGEESYYTVGMDNINYNLGMNPWDISFLTGAGSKNLNHPHNRASNPEGYNAGGIPYEYKPAKGAFMGGCKPGNVLIDEWEDYTVTETCIDFSSQLVLVAQLLAKDLPPDNEGPEFFNVVVDQVGKTSATISWETDELSRDTLYYSLTPGGPVEGKVGAELSMESSVTLRNLAPNTTYYFYLEGMDVFRNVAKDNNKGQYYQFTTSDTETPDAQITDVRICHVTHNSATVYWWTPNGPYPSAVEFSTDSANFDITKTLVDGDDEGKPVRFHKLTLQDLKPNTTYYVKVISDNTIDDNGGKYYKFTTSEVLVDYTVRIKPTKKGAGTAHFYIEVANNETEPYTGVELRFYFSADPVTAASLNPKGFDNQLYTVSGIPSDLLINYGKAVQVPGMENIWYIPLTIESTLPVAGRARIELQINGGGGWDQVPFSLFEDAWSIVPHDEPVHFEGVDLANGSVYEGPEAVENIDGKPVVTYQKTEYITAYYNGEHVYGYPPDWENNKPLTYKTVKLDLTSPVVSPVSFIEQDSNHTSVEGRTWAFPEGNITHVELNGEAVSYSPISGRQDSVSFARQLTDLPYGPSSYTIVGWHNKNSSDCACAYRNLTIEVDTVTTPPVPRIIVLSPSDSLRAYQSRREPVRIMMVDSAGMQVTDENLTLSILSSHPSIKFYSSAQSTDEVTSVNLAGGRAQVFLSGSEVVQDQMITFTPSNSSSEFAYTDGILQVSIDERPLWPVISHAEAVDLTGQAVPGAVMVVLSEPYKEGQILQSVNVDYKGNTYAYEAADITVEDSVLTVPLPSGLEADPMPSGNVTLFFTADGENQTEQGGFTDGVGPILTKAVLYENGGTLQDTAILYFSERVDRNSLIGETVQLKRKATEESVLMNVVTNHSTSEFDSVVTVTFISGDGFRAVEYDSLRLVPGAEGGTVSDLAQNLPHQQNPAVPLIPRPPKIVEGWYVDHNADGIVDSAYIQFKKRVNPDSMLVTLQWNSFVFERLRGTYPSVNDTALIGIALPDTLVELEKVETSGKMFTMVEFTNFENEVRSAELSDSAAPVVVRAVYHPAVAYDEETVLLDTLEVTFSERIAPPGNQTPLRFIQNGVEYEVALSTESVNNRSVNFLINEIRGVDRMTGGDSVWINPGEFVRDTVPNWQQNGYNSRVPLVIKSTPVTWKVVTGPNPFTRNKQVKIRIVPLGRTRIAFSPEVSIVIYDNLGNVVVPRTEFSMVDGVPQFEWNGTNRKGRYVGTGVYLGMIVVEEEETVTRKKVKLAVRRP